MKASDAIRFDRSASSLDLRALRARMMRELRRAEWEWDRKCDVLSSMEAAAYRVAISEIELVVSSREFSDARYESPYQPGRKVTAIGGPTTLLGTITRLLRDGGVEVLWDGQKEGLQYMAPHVTLRLA